MAAAAVGSTSGRFGDEARETDAAPEASDVAQSGFERTVALPSARQQTIVFIGVELQKARLFPSIPCVLFI